MSDNEIEQEIQAKGLAAPLVTLADIEAEIISEHYFTADDGVHGALSRDQLAGVEKYPEAAEAGMQQQLKLLSFCVLMLRNGTKIVGFNYGAIDPAQHSEEQGRRSARDNAIEQVWPLLGFRLRDKLAAQDVGERNKASHDMQLHASSGITYCARCGETAPGTKRSCEERQAAMRRVPAR